MKQIQVYRFLILVCCMPWFLVASPLNQIKQIDSILESTKLRVYENPNEAIEFGLSVYDNSDYTVNTKVKALMLVSLAYTSKRNYQKALEYVILADGLSKNLDDKVLQIEILFRTGILYQQLKIFDKSIEYLEKTEQMALLHPEREAVSRYIANSYTVKGFIYKDNLNCDIALEFFDKGIAEYLTVKNEEVNTNLSIAYYNKGNCYTLLSEYEKAKESFSKSIALGKLAKANSLVAFAKKGMAAVYTGQGQYQIAIDYLEAALEQSKNVGDLVLNSSIYQGLLENHLALNQLDDYQKYAELYSSSRLNIKTSERSSISDSLDDNAMRKNEALIALEQQTSNWLKLGVLFVILIIISVFFINNKNRKTITALKKTIKDLQNQKLTS